MRVVNRGIGVVFVFLSFSSLALSNWQLGAQGAASRLVFLAAASHQLLFEHRFGCASP